MFSQTFTGRLRLFMVITWGAALIVALIWFAAPAAWRAVPPKTQKSFTKSFTKMLQPIQETMTSAELPLKIIGGIILASPVIVTSGSVYFLLNTKKWQAGRASELAKIGVVSWLSIPKTDKVKWTDAADMWLRMRTPLARPDFNVLMGKGLHASFEVISIEADGVYWLMWSPDPRELEGKGKEGQDLPGTLGNAISGHNPKARITRREKDPIAGVLKGGQTQVMWMEVALGGPSQYPINTTFQGDPMMALVSNMQTDQNVQAVGMQVLVRPVNDWKGPGQQELTTMVRTQAETNAKALPKAQKDQRLTLEAKLDQFGYETVIRFYAAGSDPQSLGYRLRGIQDALGQYQGLNGFTVIGRGQSAEPVVNRAFPARLDSFGVLNAGELSCVYHLPSEKWEPVPGIKWSPARNIPPSAETIRGWGLPAHLREKS